VAIEFETEKLKSLLAICYWKALRKYLIRTAIGRITVILVYSNRLWYWIHFGIHEFHAMGMAWPTLKNEVYVSLYVLLYTWFGIQCIKLLFVKHIKQFKMHGKERGAKLPAKSWFGIHWLCDQNIHGSLSHPIQKPFDLFLGSQYCKPL
jgi:hypothetical protein